MNTSLSVFLNSCLTFGTIVLAMFGIYFVSDILIYKSFLANIVQEFITQPITVITAALKQIAEVLPVLDRTYRTRLNDPLLI